jgi:hypothetical protein
MVDHDRSTALVVVDVQNDFADPKGSLYVGEGERVVPLVNREIQRGLVAGALVVYTRTGIPPTRRTSSRAAASGPSIASSTPGVPSCTRTCGSPARWSARGRGARTATQASPSAIPAPGRRRRRRWRGCCGAAASAGCGGRAGDRLLREGDGAGRGAAGVRHGRPGRAGAGGRPAAGRRRAGACGDACRRGARRAAAGVADRGLDAAPPGLGRAADGQRVPVRRRPPSPTPSHARNPQLRASA